MPTLTFLAQSGILSMFLDSQRLLSPEMTVASCPHRLLIGRLRHDVFLASAALHSVAEVAYLNLSTELSPPCLSCILFETAANTPG